ncbi:MAG: TerD family protein, partial [Methylococcales bacterium]|nr:TerD family protein [Methylococcales bacterium]
MNILKGQRVALTSLFQNQPQADCFQIGLCVSGNKDVVDFACFGLDSQQKLSDDAYMTFFNQPKTPCGAIELSTPAGDTLGFACQLAKLPTKIDKLVFTAAIDGATSMRQIQNGHLRFLLAGQEVARFAFSGIDFQDEKAVMLGELYRKDGTWRFSAVGQGFNGGMAALVQHFGGEVAEEVPAPVTTKLSLEKKLASAPKLIDLAKKASVSLEKYQLQETIARVGLVLDASGSMMNQYRTGKVQEVINRLLPLAVHFDDDAALDVWAFSSNTIALPPATLNNYADFIDSTEGGWRDWGMMSINNEPKVIKQV